MAPTLLLTATGSPNDAVAFICFVIVVLLLGGKKKRSRHIPTHVKRQALGKFFLDHYSKPEARKKPLRLKDYEFDHVRPFSKGGSHDVDNVRVIPKKENRKKGNRW